MERVETMDFWPRVIMCTPMRFLPSPNGNGRRVLETVSMHWHRAVAQLGMPRGYHVAELRVDGKEISEARNLAAAKAIETKAKYLFFLDSDTIPPENALKLLVYDLDNNPDYDIAGGVYTDKCDPAVPLIWTEWGNGVFWDWTLGDLLRDIVACACGCMLIRVSLFERLPSTDDNPWFLNMQTAAVDTRRNEGCSEDVWFCKRAVSEADAKIMVDTRVYCGHVDIKTGEIFQLAEDTLPIRRRMERERAMSSTHHSNSEGVANDKTSTANDCASARCTILD